MLKAEVSSTELAGTTWNSPSSSRNVTTPSGLTASRIVSEITVTTLRESRASVNAALARPFTVNREWDSPDHPEQIYLRSDHYSYAKRGIPIVFYTTGLHDDYHKVSDEVSKVDFEKLSRVGELLFRTGQALGNRASRPR